MDKSDYMNVLHLIVEKLDELQALPFDRFDLEEWEVYTGLATRLIEDVE